MLSSICRELFWKFADFKNKNYLSITLTTKNCQPDGGLEYGNNETLDVRLSCWRQRVLIATR